MSEGSGEVGVSAVEVNRWIGWMLDKGDESKRWAFDGILFVIRACSCAPIEGYIPFDLVPEGCSLEWYIGP